MSDEAVRDPSTDAPPTVQPAAPGPAKRNVLGDLDLYTFWPLAVIVVVIAVTSFRSSNYLSVTNFKNVLSQMSVYGIVTMGECILLISGGIDLSVGANMAFSSICTGLLYSQGNYPMWLCIVAGLAAATGVGLINGVLASLNRAHPFIITLGMQVFLYGLATQMTGSSPVNDMGWLYSAFGADLPSYPPFFGLPSVAVPFIVAVIGTFAFLHWSPIGRRTYAIGGNEEAAYLSGIPVRRTKIILYAIMGLLAGVAAMALAGNIDEASFNLAQNYELIGIAMAVVGGTALFGGRGGALRSLQGVVLYAVVANAIFFAGFTSNYQQMALGIIIIVAVMVNRARR
jgi:ribose transport system permease protein